MKNKKLVLAIVAVSVPANWDSMSARERLHYVVSHQDNHLLVSIKELRDEKPVSGNPVS